MQDVLLHDRPIAQCNRTITQIDQMRKTQTLQRKKTILKLLAF